MNVDDDVAQAQNYRQIDKLTIAASAEITSHHTEHDLCKLQHGQGKHQGLGLEQWHLGHAQQ